MVHTISPFYETTGRDPVDPERAAAIIGVAAVLLEAEMNGLSRVEVTPPRPIACTEPDGSPLHLRPEDQGEPQSLPKRTLGHEVFFMGRAIFDEVNLRYGNGQSNPRAICFTFKDDGGRVITSSRCIIRVAEPVQADDPADARAIADTLHEVTHSLDIYKDTHCEGPVYCVMRKNTPTAEEDIAMISKGPGHMYCQGCLTRLDRSIQVIAKHNRSPLVRVRRAFRLVMGGGGLEAYQQLA